LSVESPEFKKALNEACEAQYRGWLYGGDFAKASSKDTIGATMEEIQRQRREIEEKEKKAKLYADRIRREAELMQNEHAREITENLRRLYKPESDLVCPQCGETDSRGNRMNGKPFCFKCQLVMISREKVKNWIKPVKPKVKSYTFNDPDEVVRTRRQ